jgi:hypothetical protein
MVLVVMAFNLYQNSSNTIEEGGGGGKAVKLEFPYMVMVKITIDHAHNAAKTQ